MRLTLKLNDLKDRANLLVEIYLSGLRKTEREALRERMVNVANNGMSIPEADLKKLPHNLATFHWELEFPEVFFPAQVGAIHESPLRNGFHALVSNPPFMGGQKITGVLDTPYRDYLVEYLANGTKGSADLCAYFFLKANQLVKANGHLGLVATNTIAQGDTREVGLDQICGGAGEQGSRGALLTNKTLKLASTIYRGVPSRKWEGSASLEVAYVWLRKGEWHNEYYLDDKTVTGITPYLTIPGKALGKPNKLAANQDKSFQGSIVLGMGFVLTPEEAQALIEKDPRNQDVLFPYLNGQDLNNNPDQSPSRWVINFHDWALDEEHDDPKKPKGHPYAADYPDCLRIIEEKVKPERDKNNRKVRRERWWQYAEQAAGLYEAIAERDRVLFHGFTSKYVCFGFAPTGIVYAGPHVVVALSDYADFANLQSSIHQVWVLDNCSTMKKDVRYAPSDLFETFPFPESTINLETIGETYYNHRQTIMQTRQEGLTKTYNRFHDPAETSADIIKLRQLHVEMDYAVAQAYGWEEPIPPTPLTKGGSRGLDHNFHETKQGLRYTISEPIRREILDRLLQLNFDRYAEEVAQGLHDKKKGKGKRKKASNTKVKQKSLF